MYALKNSFIAVKSKMTLLFFLLMQLSLFAQKDNFSVSKVSSASKADTSLNKRDVQIIHADKLQFYTNEKGQPIRKLVGNVQLKQDSTLLYCDSAFLLKEENLVKMFGHVKITDGDSIEATSNKLDYDGNNQKAKLIGDAVLSDSKMILIADILYYEKSSGIGYYLNEGTLVNGETILTSKKGYYHSNTTEAYFSDNVHIEDPQYALDSDTLMFNTSTKVTYFFGNTSIYNEESTILCNNGTYDTKKQVATFGANTTILNSPQTLWADSLYYEKQNGYGKVMKSFKWKDDEMKIGLNGTDAEYFENKKEIFSYNRPILNAIIEEDTLFLRGDTIIARNDLIKSFKAFKKVRVFKTDLQAVCDSLFYNNSDSVLQLFQSPILWNEGSEMKSDSVFVFIKTGRVDQIRFINNAFILSQSKGKLFDQIKGKKITAFFKSSKLEKILVVKNAESLYFGKDEQDNYMGGNQSKSAKMWIYTSKNKIKKIVFLENPEAVFTPLSQMSKTDIYLKGFETNFELKPSSKYDL